MTTTKHWSKETELMIDCPLTNGNMNYEHCCGLSTQVQCENNKGFDTTDQSVECGFEE